MLNIQNLYILLTVHLCVLYGPKDNDFPYTKLTDWYV